MKKTCFFAKCERTGNIAVNAPPCKNKTLTEEYSDNVLFFYGHFFLEPKAAIAYVS